MNRIATLATTVIFAGSLAALPAQAHTQLEHTCDTESVAYGKCQNYGWKLFPKPTATGYMHGCETPPGSEYVFFGALFFWWQGHLRIRFVTPVKAQHDFRSPEATRWVGEYTNNYLEEGKVIGWWMQMINDGRPPGFQWTYKVVQTCLIKCGCKLQRQQERMVAEQLAGRGAHLMRVRS